MSHQLEVACDETDLAFEKIGDAIIALADARESKREADLAKARVAHDEAVEVYIAAVWHERAVRRGML